MSAVCVVYRVLVCWSGYKDRVPYVGRNLTVSLTMAQSYIASGEVVELQEATEGYPKCKKR